MALYGVIADVHGNVEALRAALGLLGNCGAQRIVCLGDVVGYNADPDECVEMVRHRCAVTVAGNHDLIGLGRLDFKRCSSEAEYSLRRTRRQLQTRSKEWLASLQPCHTLEEGVVLVHAGVRDVQQYVVSAGPVRENAAFLREDFPGARLCFFGHSHEQKVYKVEGDSVEELAAEGKVALRKEDTYFVNPGSVDASRKRAAKLAECALFDTGDWSVEFLRVAYDCATTEAKAAVFGYRITALKDRLYRLRRRLSNRA